jgi:hypothetical protein
MSKAYQITPLQAAKILLAIHDEVMDYRRVRQFGGSNVEALRCHSREGYA